MGAGFYYFRFQRPMASFQFRKMRCSGHIERSPSVRSWEVLRSSALAGQGKASAPEPAICHAIRERRVCLATAEAAGANLHEVLRFQHSPNRLEKDLAGEARGPAACFPWPRPDEARAARDRASQARGGKAQGGAGHSKKSRGLLREGIDVKFSFIAKHRGIWAVDWMCEALGVSRGGFYAWLTRPRSQRSRSDEELGAKARASFLASDRTYGARRVWRDLLADG